MSTDCREWIVVIDAAGGGELPTEVAEHIEGCPSCARRHQAALQMAALIKGGGSSRQVAVALARAAMEKRGERRTWIWAAPLLSASTTLASLILYLGLAISPAVEDHVDHDAQSANRIDESRSFVPRLEAAEALSLPEPIQAINGLILTYGEEEEP